jgi:hypothetical protein
MNPSIDAATAFALVSSPAFPVLSWHKKDIVVGRRDLFPAVADGEISFPVEICQDELVPVTHPSEDPDDLVREIGFHVRVLRPSFSMRLLLARATSWFGLSWNFRRLRPRSINAAQARHVVLSAAFLSIIWYFQREPVFS